MNKMDIGSDVRYSVLKEKSSEANLTPDKQDDKFTFNTQISLDFKNSKPESSNQKERSSSTTRNIIELTNQKDHVNNNNNNKTNKNHNTTITLTNDSCSKIEIDDLDIQTVPSVDYSINLNKLKSSRSFLEKLLLTTILILVFLIFVLIITTLNYKKEINKIKNEKSKSEYCDSYRCILVSGSMYKSINKQVDPCEDFYEYSCGGWIKKNLIPSGFPRWGTLNLITYENQLAIKDQLESNKTVPEITQAENKAKIFYKSCMDTKGIIETRGAQPLLDIINKYIYKDEKNRLQLNGTFNELLNLVQVDYGLNALFEFNVLDDDKNSSYSNIEIIQGSLGLDRSFYVNISSDKNLKAVEIYKKTLLNVINLLFDKIENATEEIENFFQFEARLAGIMLPTEKLSNVETIYSRVKLGDLNKKHAPFIDWVGFLNSMLKKYGSPEKLKENDEIIVMGVEYFSSLKDVIREYQSDPVKNRTLKIALIFHIIRFSLPLLSKEYRNQFSALGEALTGTNSVERWQTCIEHTDNIFGLGYAITKMFIRASPNNAKSEAQKMIKSIKQSFIENFPLIPWMDNHTRNLAEEKVNSVDELIGYPDFIEDDKKLDFRYEDLEIKEDDYFGNEISLVQFALKSEIVTYRTKVDRSEWEMTSSAVNAYYSPTRNQIVFPSGILQEPFFHPENPMSINYGSIGSIMGHELTHGFDDSGREYDKSGMMHQWWNNKTIEDFKNASQCIVDQYNQYKVTEGEYLNGKQTLGENIADNGGLRSAYYAYEKWIAEHGEEKPLPLLKLSHRQLFFVSFAQTWCSKSTTDSLHLSLAVDQHSPPRFRVIGSISNSAEFVKAFNCPANSKMNPRNKCKLW